MSGILTVRTPRTLVLIIVLTAAFTGCGGESGDAPADDTASPGDAPAAVTEGGDADGYRTVEVANGGTIRGTIRFEGTVPPPERISSADDREACGEFQEIGLIETGAGGGLANAVLSLTDIMEGAALEPPPSAPELNQRGCRFSPHVQVVKTGSPVAILNSDPIMHNLHTLTFDNRAVNRSQPAGVERIEIEFSRPEKVRVRCDVHGWMSAWLVAVDHPYHAVTAADGTFEITDVPPGTYTLESWHESLGTSTQTVTVAAGATAEVDFVMTEGQG